MSWILAFLGFAALIILHELGHFAVAKWVGMRVERFSLFFPPLLLRKRRGETEYAIGAVPLGGYVKITGMNPHEEMAPEVAHRAYYRQPVWKRIAVIAAGPAVNIVLAFLILWGVVLSQGVPPETPNREIGAIDRAFPAAGVLRPGDELLAVDGKQGNRRQLADTINSHRCEGRLTDGCRAETPARLTVVRDGRTIDVRLRPVYDGTTKSMRVGFVFAATPFLDVGPAHAAREAAGWMWDLTTATFTTIVRIFDPEVREQISGVVGSYETTRQAVQLDTTTALTILALISLSLGIINLFPFLPLDGGHIFWALAEKIRGRAIPFSVLERAGFVGFALVLFLFMIGLTNDIDRLAGEGFRLDR